MLHGDRLSSHLNEIIAIQKMSGNWDYNPYMHGMLNGLILAKAIIEDKEPVYYDRPKEYLISKKDRSTTPRLKTEGLVVKTTSPVD